MNRICFFVLLLCAIGPGGCQDPPHGADQVPIEGIKLGDLAAGSGEAVPPQIFFRMFTFDLPADQLDHLGSVFRNMSKRQIQFADRDAFDANGFLAGFGTQQEWPALSAELDKLIARKTATRNVVVYEAAGDDISTSMLSSTQDVAWIGGDGRVKRDTFAVGRFTWMLKARPMQTIRGVAQVEIMPAYKIGTQSFLTHLAHVRDFAPFSDSGFSLRMSPGDYILLGSAGEPTGPDGSAIAPLTLNRLLFYPAERPNTLRLFVILCARIED